MPNTRGFTLIELLVVISIISIIAVIGITVFRGISAKAQDVRRKADVIAISNALEQRFDGTTSEYPTTIVDNWFSAGIKPTPPEGGQYSLIVPADKKSYQICATLSNDSQFCQQSQQGKYIAAGGAGEADSCSGTCIDSSGYNSSGVACTSGTPIAGSCITSGFTCKIGANCNPPGITFPPDQVGLTAITIQAMTIPDYLSTIRDPTLGNRITRVSDQTAFGTTNLYLTHKYAKVQAWNADSTLLYFDGYYFNTGYLMNGVTGTFLRRVNPGAIGYQSARWSNVNPNNMYGIPSTTPSGGACNTTNRMVVWHPKSDTSINPVLTELHVFSQYNSYADTSSCANMSFGLEEGNFSNDDSLGAVIGWSNVQNSWGITTFSMANVNTNTPTVTEIATTWLGAAGGVTSTPGAAAWNNISAMPKGDGVLIQWDATGPGPNQGIEWFSKDLTIRRHVTDASSHYDLGLDASGNQMVVTPCGQPGGAVANLCVGVSQTGGPPFIAGFYINNAGPTGINLNLYPYPCSQTQCPIPSFNSAIHISCRNQFGRPGWCYISDFQNDPVRTIGYQQIFALKLDGSKTVEVFGVDHGSYNSCSTCNSYTARAVPSRDGKRVLFDSDWGAGSSAPSYDYIIDWP